MFTEIDPPRSGQPSTAFDSQEQRGESFVVFLVSPDLVVGTVPKGLQIRPPRYCGGVQLPPNLDQLGHGAWHFLFAALPTA